MSKKYPFCLNGYLFRRHPIAIGFDQIDFYVSNCEGRHYIISFQTRKSVLRLTNFFAFGRCYTDTVLPDLDIPSPIVLNDFNDAIRKMWESLVYEFDRQGLISIPF